MKKTKFAAVLSLCMVPAMFWSSESQAIPSWARKYNVSCYTCHSGMPQRNAVGEAFKNNGYRFPGAQEAAYTKQKNIKIGNEEWDKAFPDAPLTGSFPQFDALSVVLTGDIVSFTQPTHNAAGTIVTPRALNINAANAGALFYGVSIGDNLTVFGEMNGFGSNAAAGSVIRSSNRAVWQFSPGFNLAFGNFFSNAGFNGTEAGGVVNVSSLLPGPATYAELNFTRGESAGYSIVAGTSMGATSATPITAANNIDDIIYVRGKVKLYGAGLLSGANGELGNSYNGLDNQVTVGAGFSSARNTVVGQGFSGNYLGETFVYGADVQAAHNNSMVGLAVSRDKDLALTNYQVDAGSFIYPWLFAKVAYKDITNRANAGVRLPQVQPSVSAWITPAVSLTGTYTYNTKTIVQAPLAAANTFIVAIRAGF